MFNLAAFWGHAASRRWLPVFVAVLYLVVGDMPPGS